MIWSYPISRPIVGVILLAMGIQYLMKYGVEFGGYGGIGNWFFLGGFSIFFPTGAFPLVIGAIVIVISLFTFVYLSFNHSAENLIIKEWRFPSFTRVQISSNDIQAMRLTNTRTGMRFLWVIVFIIPVYFLYVDGFSYLLNPNAFGSAINIGLDYIGSATVQLACMLLLVINSHYTIEIVTPDKIYEIPYYPITPGSIRRSRLAEILGIHRSQTSPAGSVASIPQAGDAKRLVCGTLLITLGIVSRVFNLWAGEMLRFVLLIAGIVIVIDALKNDLNFAHRKIDVRSVEEGHSFLLSSTGWLFKNDLYFGNVRQLSDCRKEDIVAANTTVQPRKLSIIDHSLVTGIMFFIGFQGFPVALLVPASMASFIAVRVFLVILTCAAIALAVMLNPSKVFKVKLGDRNFTVPVKMDAVQGMSPVASLFANFVNKYKMVWKTHRLQVTLRLTEMAIAAVIGMAASAVLLFV